MTSKAGVPVSPFTYKSCKLFLLLVITDWQTNMRELFNVNEEVGLIQCRHHPKITCYTIINICDCIERWLYCIGYLFIKLLRHPYKQVTDENVGVDFTYLVPLKNSTREKRTNTKKKNRLSDLASGSVPSFV